MIRQIETADIKRCLNIYNYYVENTTVTLELEALTYEEFRGRAESISQSYPYLVYEENGIVLGYAYIHEFSPRGGYKYTCEITVYVDKDCRGRGIGKALTEEIKTKAASMGLRDIISVITSENEASIAFHKALGFVDKACFDGVAEKFGRRFGVHYLQYKIK